jgi:hypothetical protein
MYNIEEITTGKSYACKFKVTTELDALGRPFPNLSDQPYGKRGEYEGFGFLLQRDLEQRLVLIGDIDSKKEFVVSFDDIWDLDDVEYVNDGP